MCVRVYVSCMDPCARGYPLTWTYGHVLSHGYVLSHGPMGMDPWARGYPLSLANASSSIVPALLSVSMYTSALTHTHTHTHTVVELDEEFNISGED